MGNTLPDAADKQPVGVASVGVPMEVDNLRIMRDLYYIAIEGDVGNGHDPRCFIGRDGEMHLQQSFGRPDYVDFRLEADQFFALGDNSAFSKDGRLWGPNNHFVPRELLIGKALFIYWPHSFDRVPYFNIPFPFFPNFKDMGFVR